MPDGIYVSVSVQAYFKSTEVFFTLLRKMLLLAKPWYWFPTIVFFHNVIVSLLIAFVFPFDAFHSNQFALNVFTCTSKMSDSSFASNRRLKEDVQLLFVSCISKNDVSSYYHIIILYHIKFPHNIQDKQIALGLGGIRQRFFCHDTCESAFEVFVFSGITTCIESIEILLNQFQEIILPWYLFFAFARQIFWEMDCFFSLSHYLLVSFLEGGAFEVPSGDFLPMISLPLKMREVWVPGMPSSLLIALKFELAEGWCTKLVQKAHEKLLNPMTRESKDYKIVQQVIILQKSSSAKDGTDLSFPLL